MNIRKIFSASPKNNDQEIQELHDLVSRAEDLRKRINVLQARFDGPMMQNLENLESLGRHDQRHAH